jgi:tetratricopeptide (TPR) repeat protein
MPFIIQLSSGMWKQARNLEAGNENRDDFPDPDGEITMRNDLTSPLPETSGVSWLREEYPDLYYMLRAAEGDAGALGWLSHKSAGLYLFTRALMGDSQASAAIIEGGAGAPPYPPGQVGPLDLDDLFGLIGVNGDTCIPVLREHRPEWALVFEGIAGNGGALELLRGENNSLYTLALAVRDRYQAYQRQATGDGGEPAEPLGNDLLSDGTQADMRCLVGEMHLKAGEYDRAIEAFTRSIENTPTSDVYEGRARAYRALAREDEQQAQRLRAQNQTS